MLSATVPRSLRQAVAAARGAEAKFVDCATVGAAAAPTVAQGHAVVPPRRHDRVPLRHRRRRRGADGGAVHELGLRAARRRHCLPQAAWNGRGKHLS